MCLFSHCALLVKLSSQINLGPRPLSRVYHCFSNKCGLKYSKDHEWVVLNDNIATIGISNFAQDTLGDIVYVELPEEGLEFELGGKLFIKRLNFNFPREIRYFIWTLNFSLLQLIV